MNRVYDQDEWDEMKRMAYRAGYYQSECGLPCLPEPTAYMRKAVEDYMKIKGSLSSDLEEEYPL